MKQSVLHMITLAQPLCAYEAHAIAVPDCARVTSLPHEREANTLNAEPCACAVSYPELRNGKAKFETLGVAQ
ncbi:MAG: hypothetical protein ABJ251_11290 [Paracoccaceae bacterium]